MGTRGSVGFVHNDIIKSFYNHFDSYPSYLGDKVLRWVHSATLDNKLDLAAELVDGLRAVDEGAQPTVDQLAELETNLSRVGMTLSESWDKRVSTGNDWYSVLRGTQGNLDQMLAAGFYFDCTNFFKDSLFCEWGYVVDLDERVLEVYKGYQAEPHNLGRFASPESYNGYYPVALVASFRFNKLPTTLANLEEL